MTRATLLAIGVALGLAAGLSGGRAFQRAPAPEAPVAGEEAPARSAAARRAEAAPAAPREGGRAPTGAESGAQPAEAGPARPGRDALARAIGALGEPSRPAGAGRISGTVRRLDGSPVEGALVTAYVFEDDLPDGARPGSTDSAPPAGQRDTGPDASLLASLRKALEKHLDDRARTRRTRTGADGAYVFTGLPRVPHWIHAFAAGADITQEDGNADNVTPDGTASFLATPRGSARVRVVDSGGAPAERATLIVSGASATMMGPGLFLVEGPPGEHSVAAGRKAGARDRWDDPYLATEPVTVTLDATAPPEAMLVLPDPSGIEGRVMPVRSASEILPERIRVQTVRLCALGDQPEPPDAPRSDLRVAMPGPDPLEGYMRGALREVEADLATGRFRVRGMTPGRYAVRAVKQLSNRETIEVFSPVTLVDVAGESVRLDLAFPAAQRGEGYVLRLEGASAAQATVSLATMEGGEVIENIGPPAQEQISGDRIWVRLEPPVLAIRANAPRQRAYLRFCIQPAHGDMLFSDIPPETPLGSEVVVAAPDAWIDVAMPPDHPALRDGFVEVYAWRSGESEPGLWRRDRQVDPATGRYRMGGFRAGETVVSLRASSTLGPWQTVEVARRTIDVRPGANSVRFDDLSSLHPLRIDLSGPAFDGYVRLYRFRDGVLEEDRPAIDVRATEVEGRHLALLERIPAGRYLVRVVLSDERGLPRDPVLAEVEVPRDRTLTLR